MASRSVPLANLAIRGPKNPNPSHSPVQIFSGARQREPGLVYREQVSSRIWVLPISYAVWPSGGSFIKVRVMGFTAGKRGRFPRAQIQGVERWQGFTTRYPFDARQLPNQGDPFSCWILGRVYWRTDNY